MFSISKCPYKGTLKNAKNGSEANLERECRDWLDQETQENQV